MRERGLMIAEAEQVADDMFRYPFQLAFAEAFGEEGYGLPVAGLPHTLPAITAADTPRVARARARRPSARSSSPSATSIPSARPPSWPARSAARAARAAAGALPALEWLVGGTGRRAASRVVARDKAQAAIAMAFPGVPRRHPDRAAAQVWAAVASGLGGRLFEALRDRRSLAYTVVASAWLKARAGALVTYIATSPEREEEAREDMLRELERFTREPVSDTELRQAINYLAGQAEVSRQSGGAVAARDPGGVDCGYRTGGAGGSGGGLPRASARRTCSGWPGRALDPPRRAEGVVRGKGAARPPVAALQS